MFPVAPASATIGSFFTAAMAGWTSDAATHPTIAPSSLDSAMRVDVPSLPSTHTLAGASSSSFTTHDPPAVVATVTSPLRSSASSFLVAPKASSASKPTRPIVESSQANCAATTFEGRVACGGSDAVTETLPWVVSVHASAPFFGEKYPAMA